MKYSDIDFKGYKNTWHYSQTAIKKFFQKKISEIDSSQNIGAVHLKYHYITFWWIDHSNTNSDKWMRLSVYERNKKGLSTNIFLEEINIFTLKNFYTILNDKISYYHKLENLQAFI